jgi:hypothetical protein
MNRRTFLYGLTLAPLVAEAQQAGKLPTIGFLGADASAFNRCCCERTRSSSDEPAHVHC